MDLSGDELAGVVDLFGALPRETLGRALVELAFKRGEEASPEDFEPAIEEAVRSYHLVPLEDDASTLVAGPAAFPEVPEGATDLPHILDVEPRAVDRSALADAVEKRFRRDAARAIDAGDEERIAHLVDVSYELEVWAPVDLSAARERLDDA